MLTFKVLSKRSHHFDSFVVNFAITFDTYADVRAAWLEYIWIANTASGTGCKGSEIP